MKRRRFLLVMLFPFAFTCAHAQRESLLIGPGDLVHVQVFDTPDLDETARVSDSGDLQLVLGGSIHVASLTPAEASRLVEGALIRAQVMYQPKVLVTVAQYTTQGVTAFGQVVKPGTYPIETGRSVLDVIALAGGFSEFATRHIVVERHGTGEQLQVFVSNDPSDTTASKVLVYPGDRVVVPKTSFVYILGDVTKPGGYPLANNESSLTILQAVALAGGTSNAAVPSKTRLVRRKPDGGYLELTVNVSAMQKGKQPDQIIQPNDILFIPFSYLRNGALGFAGIYSAAAGAALYTR